MAVVEKRWRATALGAVAPSLLVRGKGYGYLPFERCIIDTVGVNSSKEVCILLLREAKVL